MPPSLPHRLPRAALALVLTSLLIACGGGGGGAETPAPPASPPTASAPPVQRLVVAGDSLADVGTFGIKATVQSASGAAAAYPLFTERVAGTLGTGSSCSFFRSADEGRSFTSTAGCTNFAVAGALIENPPTRGGDDVAFAIGHQLRQAVVANGGSWGAGDLILIDGGGNDAAALAEAYLDAEDGGTEADLVYAALLSQQLGSSELARALAQSNGRAVAAGLYMEKLAQSFWAAVKASTLDRGATRVAIVNIPDITLMPRFRARAAADGGAFLPDLRQWVTRFNNELTRLAAGDPRVAIAPYFEDLTAQTASPAAYGLTDVSNAACPPAAEFPEGCTDAVLDAAPPAGQSRGWWRTWSYSDEFHPSPRGHELLGETVLRTLARAGWR